MKQLLKTILSAMVKNELLWKILLPIIHLGEFWKAEKTKLIAERKIKLIPRCNELGQEIFKDLTIANGIFKGMKYPGFVTNSDALFAMLLGSFESELAPVIEKLCMNDYSEILVIGCSEGYYAVGLATRIKNAQIYAYDISKEALTLCKKMAILNGVQDRIHLDYICSPDTLADFKFSKRGLIISDCEGYEMELFQQHTITNLKNCDLIIEMHDFINPEISGHIKQIFANTHSLQIINSIDDDSKARRYNFKEINNFSFEEKRLFMEENRPCIMEWAFLKSNINA